MIAAVTLQPYRLYGWFKPLAEVPLAYPQSTPTAGVILNQLADDPIEHLGALMEAPPDQ